MQSSVLCPALFVDLLMPYLIRYAYQQHWQSWSQLHGAEAWLHRAVLQLCGAVTQLLRDEAWLHGAVPQLLGVEAWLYGAVPQLRSLDPWSYTAASWSWSLAPLCRSYCSSFELEPSSFDLEPCSMEPYLSSMKSTTRHNVEHMAMHFSVQRWLGTSPG